MLEEELELLAEISLRIHNTDIIVFLAAGLVGLLDTEDHGFLLSLLQQESGRNYYVFWMRWLVDGTRWSTIDTIMVDASTGECVQYTY